MLAARPPPVARLRISCPFSHARAAHPIPSSISATVGQSGLRNVTTALTSRASLRSFSGKAPYGRESDGHRYGDEGHGCRDGSGSLLGVVGSGAHDIVGAYPASSCCRCYYSTAGRHALSSFNLARLRRKVPMLAAAATISDSPSPRHQVIQVNQTQVRGKKTRTTVKLEDLPQGMVEPPSAASETSSSSAQKQPQSQSQKQKPQPLPPLELEEEPSYPVVVLQARRNMQKFDNCVLLTRVGGFYELYFEQAEEYGPLLNIKVAQKKTNAGPVSMAGFPFYQLDRFLKILVQDLNRHVAIAEEFPNDVSGKVKSGGLMHTRRVTRIVTPGTLIDENFMDPYANNYVMAIHLYHDSPVSALSDDTESRQAGQHTTSRPPFDETGTVTPAVGAAATAATTAAPTRVGLAWLDLSTGHFFTQTTTLASLSSVLSRVSPREIVLDKALEPAYRDRDQQDAHPLFTILQEASCLLTYTPAPPREEAETEGEGKSGTGLREQLAEWEPYLESEIPEATADQFTDVEVQAGSLLLHYVRDRLQGLSMKLQPPVRYETSSVMMIDKNSMRSLEIKQTLRDGVFKGSLLHAIRRTVTQSGARLLTQWLSAPSTSLEVINFRQELVARFINDEDLRDAIITLLRRSHDSQRLVQKFALNRGDADDLLRLANTIRATEDIVNLLSSAVKKSSSDSGEGESQTDCLAQLISRISLDQPLKLAKKIRDAIDEEGLNAQHEIEDNEAGEMIALAQEIVKTEGTPEDSNLLPKAASSVTPPKTAKSKSSTKPQSLRDHYDPEKEFFIMKPGASTALTRLHAELAQLKRDKETLTESLRTRFNAPSLTLRWSPGLGHICHVKGKDARLPPKSVDDPSLEGSGTPAGEQPRTLTTSRTTRSFHHPQWTSLGEALDAVRTQIRTEESRVFALLRGRVVKNLVKLRRNALVLDELDITTSFAKLATEQGWVRPTLDNGTRTVIIGGRHPTVEGGLAEQGRTFQKNDCLIGGGTAVTHLVPPPSGLEDDVDTAKLTSPPNARNPQPSRVWLITGPNMAGKSTFLRQNALITILAQVGCYVPADYAHLGIVDAIYSRVGSADNLYQDQSTFMVEMLETAAILRQATPRSFVIMDEVGRGTTPEDGTAVAFAALHHLVTVNRCRALFATHFHDIVELVARHGLRVEDGGPDGAVDMYCTDVEEDGRGGFVYVHKLRKGVNRQSHALKVARLAGLPEQAIRVAQQILQESPKQEQHMTQDQEDTTKSETTAVVG